MVGALIRLLLFQLIGDTDHPRVSSGTRATTLNDHEPARDWIVTPLPVIALGDEWTRRSAGLSPRFRP